MSQNVFFQKCIEEHLVLYWLNFWSWLYLLTAVPSFTLYNLVDDSTYFLLRSNFNRSVFSTGVNLSPSVNFSTSTLKNQRNETYHVFSSYDCESETLICYTFHVNFL